MSLFGRVFALNAIVFVLGTLVLALSPATVSFPVQLTEAFVLIVGLGAMLLVNLVLVRLSFAPLARLTSLMRRVDLLQPGERLDVSGPPEVRELGHVFNEMLERLEGERRETSSRALAAQESERSRVARELHDEIGQALTAVLLELDRLAAQVSQELLDHVRHAQQAARAALGDVHTIARRLRPEALEDLGLRSALVALTRRFEEQTGVIVDRELAQLPPLREETELVLYRVTQESLTNVARHAQASRVLLSLSASDGRVRLRVRDDGEGFRSASQPGGGIRGMRERAMLAGGSLALVARPYGGVEVRLDVPLEPGA